MRQEQFYHLKIDASGRVVLPADVRARSHLRKGDRVLVVEDEHGLHIKTQGQALAEAQAYFAKLAPKEVSLSEELLADRRSEAERD